MLALNERPSASETVSQSEIENLLSQFGAGDSPLAETRPASLESGGMEGRERYSFPQLSFFSAIELRKLRLRHEELIRCVGAQLASYLRLESTLQMSKLETMPVNRFLASLSDPTHLTLFNLTPMAETCFLDIPPRLGLCLVDRQLGGAGTKMSTTRNLSDIEVRLISRVASLILTEWCGYWSSVLDLRASILGHEANGRFVQAAAPDTTLLVIGVSAWIRGEMVDEMQLGFPHHTLTPLLKQLSSQNESEKASRQAAASPRWNHALDELRVPLSVELPVLQSSARALAGLKIGDFISLQPESGRRAIVRLGGIPKFIGELGALDGRRAIRISAIQKNP